MRPGLSRTDKATKEHPVLYTIVVIVILVAIVLLIVNKVRGNRGV